MKQSRGRRILCRKLVSALLPALFLPLVSYATVCVDRVYNEAHLSLSLCQNHSGFNETRALLFKGRAFILNQYIEKLIRAGKLQDKKVNVQIDDQALTYSHLEITQNKSGYYLHISGYPDLDMLAGYVYWFAEKRNKPVYIAYETYNNGNWNEQEIARVNARLRSPGIEAFAHENVTVWQEGNMKMVYANDETHYAYAGNKLAVKTNCNLPVQVPRRVTDTVDRWLLVQSDSAFLYENGRQSLALAFPAKDRAYEDFGVSLRNGRVDFCWGGCQEDEHKPFRSVVFYFLRSDNKFYVVPPDQR